MSQSKAAETWVSVNIHYHEEEIKTDLYVKDEDGPGFSTFRFGQATLFVHDLEVFGKEINKAIERLKTESRKAAKETPG